MKRRQFIRQSAIGTGALYLPASFSSTARPRAPQKQYPFLWGAAYYRAPEPDPSLWETDLKKMSALGFTDVKYLIQWRWSHVAENEFYFEDTRKLLDLAHTYHLRVTLNFLLDVSPHWLYDKYPDAKPVLNNGQIVEPYAVGHRAIGGHPGPCYNHPGARFAREIFVDQVVKTFSSHPALYMWDVWNEPELCFPQRSPINIEKLACYCGHCQQAFIKYLRNSYPDLKSLNQKWGRNYSLWEQVEMARTGEAFADFIDWREFHIHTMTGEASWRINSVRRQDPHHPVFLHVVPNTMNPFNAVTTCVDDFAMASMCDVFAATTIGPLFTTQLISAGNGKVCYNVECHINGGNTSMHQKVINKEALLKDFIPQIGLGVKGFMFWQFRPEVLGLEAPAWGVVNPDGSDRDVTRACVDFWKALKPFAPALLDAQPETPAIGIWKSIKNEIFQYAEHGSLKPLYDNVNGYVDVLYQNNFSFRYVSGERLEDELTNLKLLIMPSAYCLTEQEAMCIIPWVRKGGVLIAEAHTGGYNATTGRHSRVLPGCGLSQDFGIKESLTTSSFHLNMKIAGAFNEQVSADTRKLLETTGTTGSEFFPIMEPNGKIIWGARRYAELSGENLKEEGFFEKNKTCAASKATGDGYLYYYGSRLGSGSAKDRSGLTDLIERAARKASVEKILNASSPQKGFFRADLLLSQGRPQFITLSSGSTEKMDISLTGEGEYKGVFTGTVIHFKGATPFSLEPGFTDLFVRL